MLIKMVTRLKGDADSDHSDMESDIVLASPTSTTTPTTTTTTMISLDVQTKPAAVYSSSEKVRWSSSSSSGSNPESPEQEEDPDDVLTPSAVVAVAGEERTRNVKRAEDDSVENKGVLTPSVVVVVTGEERTVNGEREGEEEEWAEKEGDEESAEGTDKYNEGKGERKEKDEEDTNEREWTGKGKDGEIKEERGEKDEQEEREKRKGKDREEKENELREKEITGIEGQEKKTFGSKEMRQTKLNCKKCDGECECECNDMDTKRTCKKCEGECECECSDVDTRRTTYDGQNGECVESKDSQNERLQEREGWRRKRLHGGRVGSCSEGDLGAKEELLEAAEAEYRDSRRREDLEEEEEGVEGSWEEIRFSEAEDQSEHEECEEDLYYGHEADMQEMGDDDEEEEEVTIDNVFQDKAENFVMAALFCASEEGNVDGLKELSEMANNIDLSTANKHGETAVHMAASGGHVDVLKFLQDRGVNISIKDKQGDTAVYWAARQGHLEAIKCLHEAGLSLDSQNKSEETALHVAARYGHAQVVDFLCTGGANINVLDSLGETPLHSAAWHGYVSIVRTLCAHQAVLDMQNKEGETVLHCAAVRGNLECIKILLDHGAALNHLDKRGSTALHLACQRHHSGIALMLLRAGCEMDSMDKETGESALHAASREGLGDVVQTMCNLGCSVDLVSADGFTPLHLAIKAGHIEISRSLLMAGAPPDAPNKDGVTGEIIALAQGFMDIADLMSKVKGDKGQTLIAQLKESESGLARIKLKVLGSTGVGKSLLIESLKVGFLGSFFRRRLPATAGTPVKVKGKLSRQFSLPTPLNYSVANPTYTKGIEIQHAAITGAGEFSVWDFSGYEPYYMLYDHFLGDVHCLHLVTFSLQDTPDEQLAQVIFWLNFLKARVPPALPIGYCGQLPNTPRVLLVATHADKAGCSRNSRGEFVSAEASTLHQKVTQMFRHDVNLADRLYILDAQVATSADMKALKNALGKDKRDIVETLGKSSGLLEATVAQLPVWRRENQLYPVLTWPQYAEAVRSKVNPLASDQHIKVQAQQLQLMGEVVYLESESGPDLVVLSPRWLCVDVIGTLMSHDKISQARITGCFSVDEFQLMFPEVDANFLLQVLEALEVCTQCEVEGDVEFEFPCLNFIETLTGLWQRDDARYSDAVYGGVRLHTSFQSGAQLKYLFPRIQVFLRRNMLGESEEQEVDLYQWHHGSKYCWGQLEGLIDMDHNEQFLEVKVRGPPDTRYALFFFLEDFVNVVEQVVENVCPGLCTERYTLSPSQLRNHGKIVRSYSPTELLRMQLEKRTAVVLSGTTTEYFLDIACMGSQEVLNHVTLGLDLDVGHLTIHTQRLLSLLLDPADPMGRDWCLLAVTLGLADFLPTLDSHDLKQVSQTQLVLAEWARRCQGTVRDLVTHLKDFNRIDGVEAILRTTPPFRTLAYEDQSTDESAGGAHGTDASTNTLSNLSR